MSSADIIPAAFPVCGAEDTQRTLKSDHSGRTSKILPFPQSGGARQVSRLSELKVGDSAVLVCLSLSEAVQNHLMHMGFVPDATVKVLRRAPAGDPTVYGVDGMEIALRHETASAMRVKSCRDASCAEVPIGQCSLAEAAR
jgi:Fe2+ transport system protein FeoA